MGASKIGKAIKEGCRDDKVMRDLLLELLDFNLSGRQWYKEKYIELIQRYAEMREDSDENQRN